MTDWEGEKGGVVVIRITIYMYRIVKHKCNKRGRILKGFFLLLLYYKEYKQAPRQGVHRLMYFIFAHSIVFMDPHRALV